MNKKPRERNVKTKMFSAETKSELYTMYDEFVNGKRIRNIISREDFQENGKFNMLITFK